MNRFFLILSAAWLASGCARGLDADGRTAVALSADFASADGVSRAATLAEGDAMGVYAQTEGRENYFLKNARWTAAADGHTLVPAAAAYYPDEKQAVVFYAVLPYFSTPTFAVPADQSGAGLKNADLCWGTAASTPVQAPVSVSFRHVLAKLSVSLTGGAIEKIMLPGAVADGTLDVRTGAFANGSTKADMFTTQNELIAPAQTLNRLVVTSGGVEYVYEGSIPLESGKTTSVTLTLHAASKTASLSGSSVSAWTEQTAGGAVGQGVSNVLSLHWVPAHPQAASVDKVVLTLKDEKSGATADYTVSSGIGWSGGAFTVPFASTTLHYPYTVKGAAIYQGSTLLLSVPDAVLLVGPTVYKSGSYSVGVKARNPYNPPTADDIVLVGNMFWAKGNLVATSSTASGLNGVKVGAPFDGGLYFQFGSLIGWKGGSQANGGTGVGPVDEAAKLTDNTRAWVGAFSWASDAMVWPTPFTNGPSGIGSLWPQNRTDNLYYFGLQDAPYSSIGQKLSDFAGFTDGTLVGPTSAVGDPCRYYLGAAWRLPTAEEYGDLFRNVYPNGTVGGTWSGTGRVWGTLNPWSSALWAIASYTDDVNSVSAGRGIYANTQKTTAAQAATDPTALFFPAAGYRNPSVGSFGNAGRLGYNWSGSVYSAADGLRFGFNYINLAPQIANPRSSGYPIRCVAEFVDAKEWAVPNNNPDSKTVNVFVPEGQSWTATVTSGEGLTVSLASGIGPGSFTMNYAANGSNITRFGNVRVTSGASTANIPTAQGNAIRIANLWWATGNLVAANPTAGPQGVGGCKIGDRFDGGLYFQLGSLVGWKGGSQANGGTGVGPVDDAAKLTNDAKGWIGAFSWASDAMVWPTPFTNGSSGIGSMWPQNRTDNLYYFGLQTNPYDLMGKKLSDYSGFTAGSLVSATSAVGDPCRYYLGAPWRLPTAEEYGNLFRNVYPNGTVGGTWSGAGANWGSPDPWSSALWTITSYTDAVNSAAAGRGIYVNTQKTTAAQAATDPTALFIPAAGQRAISSGLFAGVGRSGYLSSGSIYSTVNGFDLGFGCTIVYPQYYYGRSCGFPVRCVADAP